MCLLKKLLPARATAISEPFQFRLGRRASSRHPFCHRGRRADPNVYLPQPNFLRHTGIFGRNGSGKTLLAWQITQQQMATGGPVVYLDLKGDAAIRMDLQAQASRLGRSFRAFEFQAGELAPGYRSPLDTVLSEKDASLLWQVLMPAVVGPGGNYYREQFVYLVSAVLRGLQETQSVGLSDLWPILESVSALSEFAHRDDLSDVSKARIRALVDQYRTRDGTFEETRFKGAIGATSLRLQMLHRQLQAHPAESSSGNPDGTPFEMAQAFEPGSVTYFGFPGLEATRGEVLMLKVLLGDLHREVNSRLQGASQPEHQVLVVMDELPAQDPELLPLIRNMLEPSRAAQVGLVLVFGDAANPGETLDSLLLNVFTKLLMSGSQDLAGTLSGEILSSDQVRNLEPGQAFLLDPLRQVKFALAVMECPDVRR